VDGTNALHALGLDSGDLPADQRRLVEEVRRVVSSEDPRPEATVHFDGFPRGGGFGGTEVGGVHVAFSGGRSADDAIVEAVGRAGAGARVRVVTDDRPLARRVRGGGTSTQSVAAFFAPRRGTGVRERAPGEEKPHDAGFTPADFGLPETFDTGGPGDP
jgi:hypothetical protein